MKTPTIKKYKAGTIGTGPRGLKWLRDLKLIKIEATGKFIALTPDELRLGEKRAKRYYNHD